VAVRCDQNGMSADHNSVKNMIMKGLLHMTGGLGPQLMNPDGIYAAFEAFRRLVGAKSMAVPDYPFGNEIMVTSVDGKNTLASHSIRILPRV